MELTELKKLAAEKLRTEYTDIYGRQGLYPASEADPENFIFDSENQNLHSGQAIMFLHMNKLMTWSDIENFHRGLNTCLIMPGLYSRFPKVYDDPTRHGISHDEMTGISIGCIAVNDQSIPEQMIKYGENHGWIFIDENPGAKLFSPLSNFKKYIGRVRQPKDRALYRLAAGQKISLFEKLNMLIGSYLSSKRPSNHTSGRIMWYHKFQAIKILGNDSKILNFARKLFHKNNIKAYGHEDYMEDVYKIYFREGHPFHDLVKGLRLE